MNLRRSARRHQAGVQSEDYWEFSPGQRVMTPEGFPGVVTAVEDGPYPGAEQYLVELDQDMGGGEYSPGELRLIEETDQRTAAVPVEREDGTTVFVDSMEELEEHTAGTERTAAEDYPELGTILHERPPLPHSERIAMRQPLPTVEGGVFDMLLGPAADRMLDAQTEHGTNRYDFDSGRMASIDWCRFRLDRRCMFPKELDEEGTRQAGYAVWHPIDRGFCPRDKWTDQEACPVSEPGPNSKRPDARPDATKSWAAGGQRVGAASDVATSLEQLTDKRVPKDEEDKTPLADPDVVADIAEMVDEHRTKKTNPYGEANPYKASLREGEFTWHFTATWRDVQAKAKRIRGDGYIRVISASPTYLVGEVRGDTNIYQTTLMREPGTKRIAMWECGCAWAAYSWGRSGRWKKYEGRLCSHALALNYEGQSRGWVDAAEDAQAPGWRSDPSVTVKVPGDYKKKDHGDWRVGSVADDEDFARLVSTEAALSEPPAVGVARDMLADGDDPNQVVASLVALGVTDPTSMLTAALTTREPVFVKVRGLVRRVLDLLPGKAVVEDVGEVSPRECIYPSFDPQLGLNFHGAKTASNPLPPLPPGETPLPAGHVRLYHSTPARNLDSIRSQGLTISNAQGSSYAEPNMVWASTGLSYWDAGNHETEFGLVEFSLSWVDIAGQVIGSMDPGESPESFMAKGGNVALPFDVPASNILAIHEGWHGAYRYLLEYRDDVLLGEYDDFIGQDNAYAKAIDLIKRTAVTRQADFDWGQVSVADVRFEVEDTSSTWIDGLGRFEVVAYLDKLSHLPVGRLGVTEFDADEETGRQAGWYISNAAVIEPLRRKGIATAMLARASQHAGAEVRSSTGPFADFTADGAAWARSRGFDVSQNAGWHDQQMGAWIVGSKTAVADSEDGCMVALVPPASVAAAVVLDGGEPIDQLHVTIGYLGKARDVDLPALHAAVAEWAARWEPLPGQLGGLGTFENDEPVLYASVDAPGLDRARDDLIDICAAHGVVFADDHGFTPHLTLAYGDVERPERLPEEAKAEFEFDRVVVSCGPRWTSYALGTPPVQATVTAGCSACGGLGEQPSGHECYICDGSGSKEAELEGRAAGVTNANPENGLPVGTDLAATAVKAGTTRDGVEHKLEFVGSGSKVWARCAACHWAWPGTYGSEKQAERRRQAEAEFTRHLFLADRASTFAEVDAGTLTVEEWQAWNAENTETSNRWVTAAHTATDKKDPRFEGVGLKQDDDGWYVSTHRARSDSYPSPEDIPQSDVDYIESTGALHAEAWTPPWRQPVPAGTGGVARCIECGLPHGYVHPGETPESTRCRECGSPVEVGAKHIPPSPSVGELPQAPDLFDDDELVLVAELRGEPEPALPLTTGEEEAEDAASDFVGDETGVADDDGIGVPAAVVDEDPALRGEVVAEAAADIPGPGDPRLAWLMGGSTPSSGKEAEMNIAEGARQHLAKQALKDFTPAEQQRIIEEGSIEGVTAGNLDQLDLAGTHYEALEQALQHVEDDETWMGI